jgi:Na+-translocating ferredoxin:NAD+ oxidoreductase subunit A
MSYLSIVLTSVFSANALLVYGLGACPAFRRDGNKPLVSIVSLVVVNLFASGIFWAFRVLALAPLHLEALEAIVYAIVVAPLIKYLARALVASESPFLSRVGTSVDESALSCLVFGLALLIARRGYSLPEALLASLSSAIGYWAAIVLLDAIRERLELSALPESFKGKPALLLSAGLMAMAFMGMDTVFVKTIAG